MQLKTIAEIEVSTGVLQEWHIVSDLHLEDGSRHDRFKPRHKLLMDVGQAVGWDAMFFAGDGPDMWRCPLSKIKLAYPELIARMRHGVRGNHDRKFTRLPGGYALLGKVVVAHGCAADPWNSQWRFVGRTLTWVSERFERFFALTPGWLELPRRLEYIERYMKPWRRWVFKKFPEAAGLAHGPDHYAALHQELHGARVVADSGCWTEDADCHTVRLLPNSISLMRAVA